MKPPLIPIPQDPLEIGQIIRGRDYEDIVYSGQHQSSQWIVNHRFVVYALKLFCHYLGNRIKAASFAAGENDRFFDTRSTA